MACLKVLIKGLACCFALLSIECFVGVHFSRFQVPAQNYPSKFLVETPSCRTVMRASHSAFHQHQSPGLQEFGSRFFDTLQLGSHLRSKERLGDFRFLTDRTSCGYAKVVSTDMAVGAKASASDRENSTLDARLTVACLMLSEHHQTP